MPPLDLSNRFEDGDAFYTALVAALDARDEAQGARLLSRLVLILANAVGDHETLTEALKLAAADQD